MSAPAANGCSEAVKKLSASMKRRPRRRRNLRVRAELERAARRKLATDHLLQQSRDRFFPLNMTAHIEANLTPQPLNSGPPLIVAGGQREESPRMSQANKENNQPKDLTSSINYHEQDCVMIRQDSSHVIDPPDKRGPLRSSAERTRHLLSMLCNNLYSLALSLSDRSSAPTNRPQDRMKASKSRRSRARSLFLLLVVLVFAVCQPSSVRRVSGQMFNGDSSSSLLSAEARSNQANTRVPISNTALDQLVNFLSSINNQQANQQANTNNQRRSPPLPLGAMGNQRQLGQPQPVSSTPVNPFAAAVNFQPTRRQQVLQSPNGVQFPGGLFNQGPASSSPSPPALTLNRIASQYNGPHQQPNMNMNQNRFTNSQQLPASNVLSMQNTRLLVPQRNFARQPPVNVGSSNNNQYNPQPPPRSPLMPPPTGQPSASGQQQSQQQPKPITGFAPSGPPPGSASNAAINVVQSPANAIGQHTSPAIQMMTPFEMPLMSSASNRSLVASTTAPPTTAATTMAATSEQSIATTRQTPAPAAATTTTGSPTTLTVIASSQQNEAASQFVSSTTSASSSTSSESGSESAPITTTVESSWNPVQLQNRTRTASSSLAPSPDIVTVPPGYNPDQPAGPQNYDISVSAQMGGAVSSSSAPSTTSGQADIEPSAPSNANVEPTPTLASQPSVLVASAPTETTTIIWSSDMQASSATKTPIQPTRVPATTSYSQATATQPPTTTTTQAPSRIRDVMTQGDEPASSADSGIVYGKAAGREAKPKTPEGQPQPGRPFIQTAQLDTQVRPYSAGSQPLLKSSHGSSPSTPFKPSRPLNGNGSSGGGGGGGMSVGSGFSIVASGNQTMPTGDIQDYVANAPPPIVSLGGSPSGSAAEPTISAQGGPDPANFDLAPDASSSSKQTQGSPESPAASSTPAPRLRRPTFKPKPAVPPIRIDSCIVGDDSSCDQSHNERCVTEYGISSCHCKPGFARLSQLRGFCSPVSLLQFNMKIDKLSDDRKLVFNQSLENPNSEEYQYLEFETIQALASAIQQTSLAKQFMGARLNKFYERKNKIWANVSLNLELNNITRSEQKIQQLAQQELGRLVQQRQRQPLGESTIVLDGSRESLSKLVDVNECASKELNDCSKHAACTNEFGGYSCQCLAGYEDKSQAAPAGQSISEEDRQAARAKQGRVCMGCSAAYCSNRGECSIADGKKQCKCRANFIGARCDIDSEVLAVAVGGSLVGLIILVVTFWCLFVFNRRWSREQQKMDAMSATSGLTYNYVNSNNNSTNSLMSPLGRSQNPQLAGATITGRSAAYSMGQRFSAASNGLNSRQFHTDQQAIIGSTSSGSSAASQPIACNPYVAGYPYDEGLLIAPASTGSSEQTSPSANSYRGIIGASSSNHSAAMLAAAVNNAYTLSGHHHHHAHHHQHLLQQQQQQQQQQLAHHLHHHHHHTGGGKQLSQFHPSALMDSYATRTLQTQQAGNYCPTQQAANGYDSRWRTLQQADNSTAKQSSLAGYYLVR